MIKSFKRLFRKGKRGTQRVDLELPLRYRLSEHAEWSEGSTVNMSSGGILFRADQALKVHSPIHLSYDLPDAAAGMMSKPVDCHGEILRAETAESDGQPRMFAVKIIDYHPPQGSKPVA